MFWWASFQIFLDEWIHGNRKINSYKLSLFIFPTEAHTCSLTWQVSGENSNWGTLYTMKVNTGQMRKIVYLAWLFCVCHKYSLFRQTLGILLNLLLGLSVHFLQNPVLARILLSHYTQNPPPSISDHPRYMIKILIVHHTQNNAWLPWPIFNNPVIFSIFSARIQFIRLARTSLTHDVST